MLYQGDRELGDLTDFSSRQRSEFISEQRRAEVRRSEVRDVAEKTSREADILLNTHR